MHNLQVCAPLILTAAFSDLRHRIRRIKCDEHKPWCLRCTSTGRKCDGYASESTTTKVSSSVQPAATTAANDAGLFCPFESLEGVGLELVFRQSAFCLTGGISSLGETQEQRAMQYYQRRVAVELSGYFDPRIWGSLIPQVGYAEPAVWHAVVALSTLHEGFSVAGDLHPHNKANLIHRRLGLQQYNRAVGKTVELLNSKGHRSLDAVLVSCVLFVCHELLQYNYSMAIKHLMNGLSILAPAPESELNKPIGRLLYRIVIQSMFLGDCHVPPERLRNRTAALDLPFSCPSDARDSLDDQFITVYPFVFASPYNILTPAQAAMRCQKLSAEIARWKERFDTYLVQHRKSFTPKDSAGVQLLQIHYECLLIMLKVAGATPPEALTPAFSHVVDLATGFLATSRPASLTVNPSVASTLPFGYSFDLGLLAPLFYIAVKCTSSAIRWKAVSLLNHPLIPNREGMWGQAMAESMARHIVQVEEELDADLAQAGPRVSADEAGDLLSRIALGPAWRIKHREGVTSGKRFTSYGIEKPTEDNRTLKLVIGTKTARLKYKEQLVSW